jgi:DNA-binding CsgD family transcriptional regulator
VRRANRTADRPRDASRRVERQLLAQVDHVLHEAQHDLAVELPAPGGTQGPLAHAGSILNQVTWTALSRLEELDEADEQAEALSALALRANDLEDDVRRHALTIREQRLASVERGLSRLRRLRTSAELLDGVCQEVVRTCGFRRAMLSRIEGDAWLPWMAHFQGDPEIGREFVEWIREREITLDDLTLERELVAQKRADLVLDAPNNPRSYKPLMAAGQVTSYVVAPIIPAGRVVGLLHADHGATPREADVTDRDVLWAFAEGFGRLYERVVLRERMGSQRRSIRELFEMAETTMASMADAEIELVTPYEEDEPASEAGFEAPRDSPELDELLTAKEKEVLAMMVRGLSNAAIAERLVIKVGTVKSHVKHILRKLGAVNRAAAISKYAEMTSERR